MSIDFIRKSLETMQYFEKTSISESFNNGENYSLTVLYLADVQQFKVKSSATSETKLFDTVEDAAVWIDQIINLSTTQTL